MKKTKHIKETVCSIKRMNFCSSKKSMLKYISDMLDVDSEKRSFLELEVDSLRPPRRLVVSSSWLFRKAQAAG